MLKSFGDIVCQKVHFLRHIFIFYSFLKIGILGREPVIRQALNVILKDGCMETLVLKSCFVGFYAPLRDSFKRERACP